MRATGRHAYAIRLSSSLSVNTRIVAERDEPAAGDAHLDELCYTSDRDLWHQ